MLTRPRKHQDLLASWHPPEHLLRGPIQSVPLGRFVGLETRDHERPDECNHGDGDSREYLGRIMVVEDEVRRVRDHQTPDHIRARSHPNPLRVRVGESDVCFKVEEMQRPCKIDSGVLQPNPIFECGQAVGTRTLSRVQEAKHPSSPNRAYKKRPPKAADPGIR
jgi:hypothetical protein